MRTLITGGAGFIGINIAHKLLEKGESVVIVDNFSRTGTRANAAWLESLDLPGQLVVLALDLRTDWEKICNAIDEHMTDAVYHLAGQTAVTTSVTDPRADFENNALAAFNVLEAIRNSSQKPLIIYSSTNKVFGGMTDVKVSEGDKKYSYQDYPQGISEEHPLDFHSPYGCSKGAADQYVRDYGRIYGLKTVVFRQSCIYGPHQMGIEDQGWVAWFSIAAMLNKQITIYGNGKQVRDVLHVDDLANAYLSATDNIHNTAGQVFNIGGGPAYTMSLLELLEFLEEFFHKKIDPNFDDWRPGDQPVYISDISKAKETFGWEPKIQPYEGVKQLVAWVGENKDLFKYVEHKPVFKK